MRNIWNSYFKSAVIFRLVHVFLRLEQEIKAFEGKNGVEMRWTDQCDEFVRTLQAMEDNRKIGFLAKARSEATERMFHLKRKYSGECFLLTFS